MSPSYEKGNAGSLRFIDGVTYEHDVVIDRGKIRKRKKKPSKKFREEFGHTPVSVEEEIPWKCGRLVIGRGNYGSLPVMDKVKLEAHRRKIRTGDSPYRRSDRDIGQEVSRHECHSPCNVLIGTAGEGLANTNRFSLFDSLTQRLTK